MFSEFTVHIEEPVVEALKKIDKLPTSQTVFVLDDSKKVIGTITDGDIRRGLISGLDVNSGIPGFMNKNFKYLYEGEYNFEYINQFRKLKLRVVPLINKQGQLLKIYDFSKIKSLLPIDAVIMAGGKGERLKPLTDLTPKPLLKVGNKEIISYNFDRLHQFGISNQYITVNYLADQIEEYCKTYNSDINFSIIREEAFYGTAGALSLIEHFENDIVLLMNSDLLTNIDYEDFYKSFLDKQADMMVASIPYEVNLPYAILNTEDREVKSFQEKPKYTYYANAGIYLIKKKFTELIPEGKIYNATDLMEDVIRQGYRLVHYPLRNYWLDIGKHEDFEKAQKDVAHIDFD